MTALHERLQDEYGDALDELWKARGCNNDDPLYLRFLPYHATIRHLAAEVEAATALQSSGGEVVVGVERAEYFSPTEGGHFLRVVYRWPHKSKLLRHTQFVELRSKDQVEHLVALLTASPAQPSGAKDAARYRWLRNEAVMAASPHGEDGQMVWAVIGNGAYDVRPIELDELDAHIDAAMLTAAPAPIEQEG